MKKIFAVMAVLCGLMLTSCHNEPVQPKVSFKITVSDITTSSAKVTVVPSDTQVYYYFDILSASYVDSLGSDSALAMDNIDYIESRVAYHQEKGDGFADTFVTWLWQGIWTVNDVMTSLEGKPRGARAYIAINGYYLAIDSKGGVFSESDDDDVIGCHADIIGEYEVPKPREEAEPQKPNREEQIMKIVLWVLFLGTLAFLGYKIYAMIAHTGDSLWESILWIVVCLIVLTVSGLTLFYSKEE